MKKILATLCATLAFSSAANAIGTLNVLDIKQGKSTTKPVYQIQCFRGVQTILLKQSNEPFRLNDEHTYIILEDDQAKIVPRANCYVTMNKMAMLKEGLIKPDLSSK
ncbi:hypothetical protein [Vibrio owensii]|uniref:hypothetical protein n=1 Tax=Vibrio harveyi group TaxID=717610 RepID=UPI003CC5C063